MVLLEDCTARNLTDSSEILYASEGIPTVFRKSMRYEPILGPPETQLDQALLWIDSGPHKRRTILVKGREAIPFPGWLAERERHRNQ